MEARRREVRRLPHHEQESLCSTRLPYRQGRLLTAVKVYTVNDEAQHLIISGVPSLGLQDNLRKLCSRYGDVKSLTFIPNFTTEKFEEAYHVHFTRIQSARFAKKQIDGKAFFGGSLHVCYAPEMETISETRNKLIQRRREVARRISLSSLSSTLSHSNAEKHTASQYPSTEELVWNGIRVTTDPRILRPAEELEMLSSANYGPHQCLPDWKDVGIRQIVTTPNRSKTCSHSLKVPHNPLQSALNISAPLGTKFKDMQQTDASFSTNQKSASIPPILRLVPTQVKGAPKRILFHSKQNHDPDLSSGNQSLDASIESVRSKIRAVTVPNVKILLDKTDKIIQNICGS